MKSKELGILTVEKKIPGKCPECSGELINKERVIYHRFPGDILPTGIIETWHTCKECRFYFHSDFLRGYWSGWKDGTNVV